MECRSWGNENNMSKNVLIIENIGRARIMAQLRKVANTTMLVLVWFMILSVTPASSYIDRVPDVAPGAVASNNPIFHDPLSRGIELIFNDQYEEGLAIFDRLQRTYPDHPAPYFFRAATYQNWMSSIRVKRFEKELEENVRLAIEKGYELLKREDDPWLHFYIGAAYGYRAFNQFRKHDWIGAYIDAKKGVEEFRKALTKNPNLYDVYLGLGSYHYWRTAKSRFIRIIAFWMSDKRELGLRQLEFSIEHGLYAKHQASYNLIAAYFDYGRYEKAMDILDRTLESKDSPGISDLYYKGRLLAKFERWLEAESVFREILERLENCTFASVGYQVECKYWIALALKAQNKDAKALHWIERALAQSKKRNGDLELEGPFENFGEIRNKLHSLHRDLTMEPVFFDREGGP